MLSDERWFVFACGGVLGTVDVCHLPSCVRESFQTSAAIIKIKHGYAPKIRHKHGVKPEYFHLLVPTIQLGSIVNDGKSAIFHKYHEHVGCHFEAVVKIIRHRDEAWVTTFHQVDRSEIRRKQRKYALIRE